MSREIKFRAWDIDNKKYEYDIAIRPINRVIGIEIFNNEMYPVEFRGIVEQYTGLKDKNGKEIYEGDIVKGDMGVFEVKWYDLVAQFMFKPNMSMKYHPPFTSTQLKVMEVIGNVHENPELLGGEDGQE